MDFSLILCGEKNFYRTAITKKGETTLFVVSPFPVFGTLFHSETRSRAACAEIQPFRRNHACLAARNKRPNHV